MLCAPAAASLRAKGRRDRSPCRRLVRNSFAEGRHLRCKMKIRSIHERAWETTRGRWGIECRNRPIQACAVPSWRHPGQREPLGKEQLSAKCTKAPSGLVRVICGTGRLANAMHERSLHAAALTIRQHPAASASLHKSRGPRPRSLMSFCRAWHITSQERAWTGCYCRYHFWVHDRAGCSGWMPCSSAGCRHGLLAGPPPLSPRRPGRTWLNCGN